MQSVIPGVIITSRLQILQSIGEIIMRFSLSDQKGKDAATLASSPSCPSSSSSSLPPSCSPSLLSLSSLLLHPRPHAHGIETSTPCAVVE
eukprot:746940-Hanusia_phi.AAC.3